MSKPDSNTYDAVIIGAGIGGLVCGCYLAKAGMKVLIAEQHHKPGGYCTSFKRKGFTFDAAVQSFGGYRKDGIVRKVFKDLNIDKEINIERDDPSDTVITPHYKISFWANTDKTVTGLEEVFPAERDNIRKFFKFLKNPEQPFLHSIRNLTFKHLLDQFFSCERLKATLSFPLFGDIGLPPSQVSAFGAAIVYKEFILDGGYFVSGGMQNLPNILSKRFKEFGGELLLSCPVKKIKIKDNQVTGVVIDKNRFKHTKYVISNCDARQTFTKLLGKNAISQDFLEKISNMTPSLSAFILYLGLDKDFIKSFPSLSLWVLSDYNLDNAYFETKKGNLNNIAGYCIRFSPKNRSITVFMNAPFKNIKYWESNRDNIIESLIKKIESEVIPELSKHIMVKVSATPQTLYRYTLNYKGATYGWAWIPSQIMDPDIKKPPFLKNIYLTGHWSTKGFGIPGVIYDGYETAKIILKKEKFMYN